MGTKKILNKDVSNVVEESLAGYLMAYRKYYKKVGGYNAFTYKGHRKGKVALVIGGGSGHEPLFTGYCGAGLADAVACGNVCASPNPELIIEAAKAVDQGKGVLFVYVNFSYQRDNLRNSDLRSNPCFTRVCGVVRCGEKRWNLLSSQRICNTFATKISKKYRTLFGDRHWRVSFLLCRFCIGSYAVLIF